MEKKYQKKQKVFELWVSRQFNETLDLTEDFKYGGYSNMETNCLWVGFCAGVTLSEETK